MSGDQAGRRRSVTCPHGWLLIEGEGCPEDTTCNTSSGRSSTPTERTEMNVVSQWVRAMPCTIIGLCLAAFAGLLTAICFGVPEGVVVSNVGTLLAFGLGAFWLDRR